MLLPIILGIIFTAITAFYGWLFLRHMAKVNQVLAYPVTEGRVVQAEVMLGDIHEKPEKVTLKPLGHGQDTIGSKNMYYPKVVCTYEWEGSTYTTDKLGANPVRFRKLHSADKIAKGFSSGAKVDVHIPQDQPAEGVIQPKMTGYDFVAIQVLGGGGMILAIIAFLALSGTMGGALIAGIIQAVFGAFLVWTLGNLIYKEYKPRKLSQVTGTIIDKSINEWATGEGESEVVGGGGIIYVPFVEVRYSQDGTDYSTSFNTYGSSFKSREEAEKYLERYQIGEEFHILVDPNDPVYVLREQQSHFSLKDWTGWIIVMALVFSLLLMGNGLRIVIF